MARGRKKSISNSKPPKMTASEPIVEETMGSELPELEVEKIEEEEILVAKEVESSEEEILEQKEPLLAYKISSPRPRGFWCAHRKFVKEPEIILKSELSEIEIKEIEESLPIYLKVELIDLNNAE